MRRLWTRMCSTCNSRRCRCSNPTINQRQVSGSVVLTAGQYGHDRWKAGTGGCTYTFSTTNNVTTITISAGTLVQVVEGGSLLSGSYTFSWTGTAQGRINAAAFAVGPVTATLTGGTNASVEFSTGTFSLAQLEAGTNATPFDIRDRWPVRHAVQRL